MLDIAKRLLQQQDGGAAGGAEEAPPANTLDLRITAVFVILFSGLLGGLLPLMVKCFRNPAHPATLILRALAAGVMLALAIIHIIPDGMADLEQLHAYNFGALAVVVGCLVMVMTESLSRAFLHNRTQQSSHPHTAGADQPQQRGHAHDHDHAHEHEHKHAHKHAESRAEVSMSMVPEPSKPSLARCSHDGEHGVWQGDGHSHTCLAVNNAAGWAANPQAATIRNQVIAYMFELACVVHSFLIGLSLGVTVDSRQQATALMVALIFHQGLEGIGLGSTVVKANFAWWKGLIMIITYAIMTPLGVAIGMGIANSYDPESVTALAVQGTLNSISGGLLLYISLVQLIAEDFTRADLAEVSAWSQVAMHIALAVGAGCMAVIGIWK